MINKPELNETATVLGETVEIFDRLSIGYFLTGSLASGVRGEFRATNDIDIVAEIPADTLPIFINEVNKKKIADESHIAKAHSLVFGPHRETLNYYASGKFVTRSPSARIPLSPTTRTRLVHNFPYYQKGDCAYCDNAVCCNGYGG